MPFCVSPPPVTRPARRFGGVNVTPPGDCPECGWDLREAYHPEPAPQTDIA